jgi:hypothetical protein
MTYAALMQQQRHIRVPMLQRDYAQGRADQADVRDAFLAALENALKRRSDDPELPLNLDFIYGSIEGGGDQTRFAPLDGQQRLTTLFLLHWFLAWQDGAWDAFATMFRAQDGTSRFTYKVRQSSTEFFDKLVAFQPASRPEAIESVGALICDQPWYFRHWRLDPTVQSALTMLDAIHERFRGSTGLFARLTDSQAPAITFQLLLLEKLSLSDDLYIKMNARGKPLTAFENFKAQYEQLLADKFTQHTRTINGRSYSLAKFVAQRMDTAWADFFWPHRNEKTNLCDEVMMSLFRLLALITRDQEKEVVYVQDATILRDTQRLASYSAFHSRGWLTEEFTDTLCALLEAWTAHPTSKGSFPALLPDNRYFDEAAVFQKIRRGVVPLTFTEVAQFTGYVLFVRQHPGSIRTAAFPEWMRVVGNLSLNTPIEQASLLRTAARGLRELVPHALDILTHLATQPKDFSVTGFYRPQVTEEQVKAGLILHHAAWRPLIDQAEAHGYFRGQIDFLCEFSGVNACCKRLPGFSWGEAIHVELQRAFASYYEKAKIMFSADGLRDDDLHRWTRALLATGDYLLPQNSNYSFLNDAVTETVSWKRLLRTSGFSDSEESKNRGLLKALWEKLDVTKPIHPQLDEVITSATALPPWREALVRTPAAINYCGRRAIRWNTDADVMLLSKTTMRGEHAELFTFCLHKKLEASPQLAAPLIASGYTSQNDSLTPPYSRLLFACLGKKLFFRLSFEGGAFHLRVDSPSLIPKLHEMLIERGGFEKPAENAPLRSRIIPRAEILEALAQLGKLLATLPTQNSPS